LASHLGEPWRCERIAETSGEGGRQRRRQSGESIAFALCGTREQALEDGKRSAEPPELTRHVGLYGDHVDEPGRAHRAPHQAVGQPTPAGGMARLVDRR
jgi:hypothetical protein